MDLSRGKVLSAWATGLPENADRVNLHVLLGGQRMRVDYVEPENTAKQTADGPERQINILVPDDAPAGELQLAINGSEPVAIRIER